MKKLFLLPAFFFQLVFSEVNAIPGYWEWAKQTGNNEDVSGRVISIDPSGNIILLGHFLSPTMSLSGVTLNRTGTEATFIAKYSPSGTLLWLRTLESEPLGSAAAITLTCDNNGDFIIGGTYRETLTIDHIILTDPPNSGINLFLAKFDTNGQAIWAKNFSNGFSIFWDMSTDALGNIFVTGAFQSDSAQFDSFTLHNYMNDGSRDVFTLKCNNNGDVLWASQLGGIFDDTPNDIAIDASGNAIVSGLFRSSYMNCGLFSIQNSSVDSTHEIFISKIDVSGNVIWAKSAGSIDHDNAAEVAIDQLGNIYLTGNFEGSTTYFDTIFVYGNGSCSNTYLVKISPTGQFNWAMSYGNINNNNIANEVSIDANGEFYLGGSFSQTLYINGQTLMGHGGFNLYLAKFDLNRNLVWNCIAGSAGMDVLSNMVKDSQGNVYVTGYSLENVINFGSHSINYTSSNTYKFFFAKISQQATTHIDGLPKYNTFIFPNPAHDVFYLTSDIPGNLTIEVFNQLGEIILSSELENYPGFSLPVEMSGFSNGIYLVKVSGNGNVMVNRIIKE